MVGGAPVYEIEVEIVLKSGRIQHFARYFVDLPDLEVLHCLRYMEGIVEVRLWLAGPLVAVSQDIAVLKWHQFLLTGSILSSQNLLAEDLSNGHVLRIDLPFVLLLILVLLALVVVEGQFAVGDESVVDDRTALHFSPFLDQR